MTPFPGEPVQATPGYYVDPDDYDLDTPRYNLRMPVLKWMHESEHDWSLYTGNNYQA